MHTLIVTVIGAALALLTMTAGRVLDYNARTVLLAFLAVWLVAMAAHGIVGVIAGQRAGLEVLVFILVYGVPAIAALLLYWRPWH